jgi:ATP-binding cassette subfamily B (MDR/TAP) protein 1
MLAVSTLWHTIMISDTKQCLISAFVHAPRLAGFLFAIVPTTGVLFTALGYWSDNVLTALAPLDGRASSLIEQILSSVRIVQSFDLGPRLIRKLEHDMLGPLRRAAKKKSGVRALEQATVYGLGFLVYCMAYWFGGIEVARGLEVGDLLTVSFRFPAW